MLRARIDAQLASHDGAMTDAVLTDMNELTEMYHGQHGEWSVVPPTPESFAALLETRPPDDGQYAAFWTPEFTGPVTITVTASAPPAYDDVSEYLLGDVASGPTIETFRGPKEPGTILRIFGQNFGDSQGDSVVHVNKLALDSTSNRIKTWTDTKIRVKLPFVSKGCEWFVHGNATCRKRKVWVTVGGEDSNFKTLRVKKPAAACP